MVIDLSLINTCVSTQFTDRGRPLVLPRNRTNDDTGSRTVSFPRVVHVSTLRTRGTSDESGTPGPRLLQGEGPSGTRELPRGQSRTL